MLHWLQDNVFLAVWLAPFVPLLTLGFRSYKNRTPLDLETIVILSLGTLSVVALFTPFFDDTARDAARTLLFFFLGYVGVGRLRRTKPASDS